MTAAQSRKQRQEYEFKLALIGLFFALFAALAPRRRNANGHEIRALDVGMLGLAALRAGRLLSYDRVTEPVREPFTETEPDEFGASDTVVPQSGSAIRETLGQLISCPICSGTWAAAAMAYFVRLAPLPGRFFLLIMSATGLAEVLNALVEALEWTSQAERKDVGQSS
ncbi:MAG TPA: DUF1360 domain-containing protein [Thermomicrobiales bacterium]|nr:DUF1360 domain-containing protein [Thermomicrobiales bacterium]